MSDIRQSSIPVRKDQLKYVNLEPAPRSPDRKAGLKPVLQQQSRNPAKLSRIIRHQRRAISHGGRRDHRIQRTNLLPLPFKLNLNTSRNLRGAFIESQHAADGNQVRQLLPAPSGILAPQHAPLYFK